MAVKLHRCPTDWLRIAGHPCWRVQKALDDAGIEYEVAKGPLRRSRREETIEKTGQKLYPWLELEDGSIVREDAKELEARIRSGRLFEGRAPASPG